MAADVVSSNEITSWIEIAVANENLHNCKVVVTGKSEKGDGYVGEIVFAEVNSTTSEDKEKTLHLVVKHSKRNKRLRETAPVKLAFEVEIHFYDKEFPAFRRFQLKRNVQDIFNSVPKCYKTLMTDDMEVLVFENLKERGFELHDKSTTLNMCHLKTVLREYGKLHALSFAIRDQAREEFEALTADCKDVLAESLNAADLCGSFIKFTNNALELLAKNNEVELLGKYKKFFVKECHEMLKDVLRMEEPQSVVIHGDCWNNNFMFKYEDSDMTSPSHVAILDWQMSTLRSPVIDLSYFIYSTASSEEFAKLDELLATYYASFSSFLRDLGSDPEVLFPYSDLITHWTKYSSFGLLMIPMILAFVLCDKEDAPAFEDLQDDQTLGDLLVINVAERGPYFDRLKAVASHYFSNMI